MNQKDFFTFFGIFINDRIIAPYWVTIIGILVVTLIGYRFTFTRDRINRNKIAIVEFKKVMSEEREKLIKNSVMDIHRQENAYVILYPQLFLLQKIRLRNIWGKYLKTEEKQKEYVVQWVLYHNKAEVLYYLTKLVNFK